MVNSCLLETASPHSILLFCKSLHCCYSVTITSEGVSGEHPLQCSCLENPRDGGAWWAAVYGVAKSWTRLNQLSSSSSSHSLTFGQDLAQASAPSQTLIPSLVLSPQHQAYILIIVSEILGGLLMPSVVLTSSRITWELDGNAESASKVSES